MTTRRIDRPRMLFAAALALVAAPAAVHADLSTVRAQQWRDQPGSGVVGVYWPGDHFGQSLAAGDFDGDGHDDLAIGDREGSDIANAGAVHVLYSDAGGLQSADDQLFSDFNPSTGAPDREPEDNFGRTLAVGDFDSNGYDDLAIGIPGEFVAPASIRAGSVLVLYGRPAGSGGPGLTTAGALKLTPLGAGAFSDDLFGSALAVGDFNGDSDDDLAVGASGTEVGGLQEAGAFYVFFGSGLGLSTTGYQKFDQNSVQFGDPMLGTPEAGDLFGFALAAGDFDGDDVDDLAVGSPGDLSGGFNNCGSFNVVYGFDEFGLVLEGNQLWYQHTADIGEDIESEDYWGAALAAGDITGDDVDDLVVGAPYEDKEGPGGTVPDAGAITVLWGAAGSGIGTFGSIRYFQENTQTGVFDGPFENFGFSLAMGDFDDDGYADVAIGTPQAGVVEPSFGDYGIAGNVITMVGSPVGFLTGFSTLWTEGLRGHPNFPANDERYGFALATGDFDGNDSVDLAIGAISEDGVDGSGNPVANGGIAFVLYSFLFADGFESGDFGAWSSTTPLAAPPRAAATDPGTNLSDNAAPQTFPSISGDRVVWQDYRTPDGLPAIVLLDLETRQLTQVTPPGTENGPPVIDGDRIVYARLPPSPGGWKLLAYDIPTGVETQFGRESRAIGLGKFSLSGDRVVWHARRRNNWDVYLYDFAAQAERRITTDPADQADPSIDGDLIAWADRRHGGVWWDLYTYDLRTETEARITQETTLGRGPAVSGGRIVWGDLRGGYFGLYEYDVDSGTERGPHPTTPIENGLDLSGDFATWYSPDYNVLIYDFLAGVERKVTRLPERQWFPDLSGLNLVWQDERGGEEEIYFVRIPDIGE